LHWGHFKCNIAAADKTGIISSRSLSTTIDSQKCSNLWKWQLKVCCLKCKLYLYWKLGGCSYWWCVKTWGEMVGHFLSHYTEIHTSLWSVALLETYFVACVYQVQKHHNEWPYVMYEFWWTSLDWSMCIAFAIFHPVKWFWQMQQVSG
jgi:hypothetical protein